MKKITLSHSKGFVLVDDVEYDQVNKHKWHLSNYGYAIRTDYRGGQKKTIMMHRQIMGITDSRVEVDHRNTNGLDNRRENLRVCVHAQNGMNRSRNKNNTSGYKGVCFKKHVKVKNWQAQIAVRGKIIHLGYFNTAMEAALVYNEAALIHHGEFAHLNQV